ncbi:hypothetical protein ACLOJK_012327 [Asimina triloba]
MEPRWSLKQQTANYGQEELIRHMEREAAERAMVWDRRFDSLDQQIMDVREGMRRFDDRSQQIMDVREEMWFILSKIVSIGEDRSSPNVQQGFNMQEALPQ